MRSGAARLGYDPKQPGPALAVLGERESGMARLDEAVAAYGAALEEMTRDRVPLQWATSTGNQGMALMLLAERLGDATRGSGPSSRSRWPT